MRDVTRENVGKRMAILLFEKGKGEVADGAGDPAASSAAASRSPAA